MKQNIITIRIIVETPTPILMEQKAYLTPLDYYYSFGDVYDNSRPPKHCVNCDQNLPLAAKTCWKCYTIQK